MSSSTNENQSSPNENPKNGLPPPLPNAKQQIPLCLQQKVQAEHAHLPNIDSNFLFQSTNLPKDDTEQEIKNCRNQSSQFNLKQFQNDSSFIKDNGSIEKFNAQQKSENDHQPEIDIETYFEDFYRREIEASQSATKDECLEIVEPYSIEHYAQNNFRQQLGVVILNKQGIKKLTTFSDKPYSRPLLKKIPLKKKEVVKKLASYILIYIGVYHDKIQDLYYKNKKDEQMRSLFLAIMYMLHNDESLIDECYMQLMKAMRETPTEEVLHRCWNLFLAVASLFNVVDWNVQTVVRWFLVNRMFSDDLNGQFARYSFINFHDRLVLGRSFDTKTTKKEILEIPSGVKNGKHAFRSSLYIQMWNQRRKYPKLPIPLTLYLVVKALIKNGVLVTPKPFPFLRTITLFTKFKNANVQSSTDSETKRNEELINNEVMDDEFAEEEEAEDKSEEISKDQIKIDDVIKASNQMFDAAETAASTTDFEEEEESMDESYDVTENEDERTPIKKCNLRVIKQWSEKIFDNENAIDDGEVCDLMGFLLSWILNLIDPIVPKSMSNYFIETFDSESPKPNDYSDFIENLPILHKNTLKYIIGFLREISKNQDITQESNATISQTLATYFVSTTFATIEPFTRIKMIEIAPRFLLYCLEKVDVSDIYPLNPEYLVKNEE